MFASKPACADPAGCQSCLETYAAAVAAQTAIVAGTQYRRQVNYLGAVEQIRAGAIGDVIDATARYCGGGIWHRPREEGMSDAAYQLTNWMHFIWLIGDHIVEQAAHDIDTLHWVMGENRTRPWAPTAGSRGRMAASEGTASASTTIIPVVASSRSIASRSPTPLRTGPA